MVYHSVKKRCLYYGLVYNSVKKRCLCYGLVYNAVKKGYLYYGLVYNSVKKRCLYYGLVFNSVKKRCLYYGLVYNSVKKRCLYYGLDVLDVLLVISLHDCLRGLMFLGYLISDNNIDQRVSIIFILQTLFLTDYTGCTRVQLC